MRDCNSPTSVTPQISFINPSSVGASNFSLTINGSGFDSGVIDQIFLGSTLIGNGSITGRTGSTQIVVTESMANATPGAYTVRVKNSDGTLSNGATLTLTASTVLTPTISSVSPNPLPASSAATLDLYGSNFQAGVALLFSYNNGTTAAPVRTDAAFYDSTHLRIVINTGTPSDTWTVKAQNPGGSYSSPFTFSVVTSATVTPTITSVSPNPVTGSPNAQTVTINGTGFANLPTLLVTWTGGSSTLSGSQVTFVSSTQLQMTITTQNDPDNWTVKVTNPSGGASSSAFPFTVIAPTPSISSLTTNPGSPTTGTFSFTINGSGFSSAVALIHVTGPGCTPCTVPNNVLTTKTTSTLSGPVTLNTAGTYSFVVQNGFQTANMSEPV